MDINFIENMPPDNMVAKRCARQQEIAASHPDYTPEKHEADNRELAERFVDQESTRQAAIDEIEQKL